MAPSNPLLRNGWRTRYPGPLFRTRGERGESNPGGAHLAARTASGDTVGWLWRSWRVLAYFDAILPISTFTASSLWEGGHTWSSVTHSMGSSWFTNKARTMLR